MTNDTEPRPSGTRPAPTPDSDRQQDRWQRYWVGIGNEDLLTAHELLGLSPRVRDFFAGYLIDAEYPVYAELGSPAGQRRRLELNWDAAGRDAVTEAFSSTEARLATLVLAVATGTPFRLADAAAMGSWEQPVWRTLVEWGTQGRHTTRALP